MNPKIEIENLLHIEAATPEARQTARKAATAALAETATAIRVDDGGRVRFACEWDPPFKTLREVSKNLPETTLVLWSDAFAKHHWICKAEITGGKCHETVVSRIDDTFDAIFKEVYSRPYEEWEKSPTPPFPRQAAS